MIQWLLPMDYKTIQQTVSQRLQESDSIIHSSLKHRIRLIRSLTRATPIGEGKRIRSTFFFLLAAMTDTRSPLLPQMAASIELLHLSSLIHDDIIDNSQLRRGKQTSSRTFGNHLSVLWGDFLFITALNMVRELGNRHITDAIIESSRTMIEGQILEYENTDNHALTLRTHFDIIRKKTASLFSGIARVVAILHKKKRPDSSIEKFGDSFGMIFQMRDDLLDIVSPNSGKDRFCDLREGKITLPYILYLKKTGKRLPPDMPLGEREKLLQSMKDHKIEEMTQSHIRRYAKRCRNYIHSFPDSKYRHALSGLLEYIAVRDY